MDMGMGPRKFSISLLVAVLMLVPCKTIRCQSDAVQFIDITGPAGITFKHVWSSEKKYIVESMSGGVKFFDYDNEGYLGIFLVNSLTVELLKSNKLTVTALYPKKGATTFFNSTNKTALSAFGWS